MNQYQVDIRKSDNIIEVQVNNEKARIGFQYQQNHNCKYNYIFMLNEDQKEREKVWADVKEKLSQPSIRPVWRMSLSKGVELIKKMNKLNFYTKSSNWKD